MEGRVLKLIRVYLTEMGVQTISRLELDSSIEDDLGIDSIGRAEILRLLEKEFSISISDQALLNAEKIEDIVDIVYSSQPVEKAEVHGHEQKSSELQIPKRANTLIKVLEHYVSLDADKVHIRLLDENDEESVITYGQLYDEAQEVARGLQALGIGRGDTVALLLPTCESFFFAFMGILYAGAIPVPIYPPLRARDIERYVKNEEKILKNAEVRVLITVDKAKGVSRLIKSFIPTLKKVATVEELQSLSDKPLHHVSIKAEDPALIQYTSGSTGVPKGVLLEHQNILTNLSMINKRINVNKDDVIVSWLPLYHDMGLIGAWLGSLYYGVPLVLLSPITFLMHPKKWLWAIHRYKGTMTASPNFGYELCNNKITDDDIKGLDLSSLRLALNGAETIYAKTLRNFIDKFKPYHLSPKALFPAYGLAESTVALTFPDVEKNFYVEKIDRDIFVDKGRGELLKDDSHEYLEFVSCGKPLEGQELRIVNKDGDLLPERRVGYIQFRGPSTMQGYYHNPEAVNDAFNDGWWDTGDMGYVANGELYLTGRKKDLIIKAGHNIYPNDIEPKVAELAQIRSGGVVVFGVHEERQATEKVVVVAEVDQRAIKSENKLVTLVHGKVKEAIGMPADDVVFVPPQTIPKTSSGKLQRSAAKVLYINHQLKAQTLPTTLQLIKLVSQGAFRTVKRWLGLSLRFLYGIYVGLAIVLTMAPMWLSLFILPYKARIHLAKWAPRALIFLIGCPLKVNGLRNIRHGKRLLYLSNHTSFFDTIVLQAVLPAGTLFLAKAELLNATFIRSFIKRLGHLTITRQDIKSGEEQMQKITKVLKQGKSVVIYPEGTFSYARGVQRFKLGAFTLAKENNVPICPVALKGTRDVLRSGELLPRPGSVEVTIGAWVDPALEDWSDLTLVRDRVRDFISEHSGEEKL